VVGLGLIWIPQKGGLIEKFRWEGFWDLTLFNFLTGFGLFGKALIQGIFQQTRSIGFGG